MKDLNSILESLLLAAGKPMAIKELAEFLAVEESRISQAGAELQQKFNEDENSGIHLAINNQKFQLITNPQHAKVLNDYFEDETTGELTKPSLETLTIIAYRQPITKEELEQIRGVNCSLIIRNLLIRGLIEEVDDKNQLATTYAVTMDFLRHMGISSVEELPDFEKLNNNENLNKLLEENIGAEEQVDAGK
ncbi:SMC-Scp complex subunit ScpB [Candidatus Parcubacteria bacterium]|nr:MAG: SMC-Scp complex subunit ScpB [Candidatus Parcubacteria bacterium]